MAHTPTPLGTTPPHTFAAGWNAACDGQPFTESETTAWKAGWAEARVIHPKDKARFRFNAEADAAAWRDLRGYSKAGAL